MMIVLFTDYGLQGPYQAQLQVAIHREAPNEKIISLFCDLAPFDVKSAAYLLPAYINEFSTGTVFLCVVDPGVGSDRLPIVVHADGCWYVGPNNGLLNVIISRASHCQVWKVDWTPRNLSKTFHGRDLFAVIAARIAQNKAFQKSEIDMDEFGIEYWPEDLNQVVYIDGFGNAITGIRGDRLPNTARITVNSKSLLYAEAFHAAPLGKAFWYINANGLVEIAMNCGRACDLLGIEIGDTVSLKS